MPAPNTLKKAHQTMKFTFTGLAQAHHMRNKLTQLGCQADIAWNNRTWEVHTNTRCLAHADELVRFLYGRTPPQ